MSAAFLNAALAPLHLVLVMLATSMAGVIVARCVVVLNGMHPKSRDRAYLVWLAFGLSYALLALAAAGAAVQVIEQRASTGDWLFLTASFGLIVFDRRRKVAT